MLRLYEVTLHQDRILTFHSALSRDWYERAQIDTLPFGMLWWPMARPVILDVN